MASAKAWYAHTDHGDCTHFCQPGLLDGCGLGGAAARDGERARSKARDCINEGVILTSLSSTPPPRTWIRRFGKPKVQEPPLGGGLGHPEKSKVQDPPLEGVLAELESPSSKTPPLGPAGGTSDLFLLKTVSEQHQSMSLAVDTPQMT